MSAKIVSSSGSRMDDSEYSRSWKTSNSSGIGSKVPTKYHLLRNTAPKFTAFRCPHTLDTAPPVSPSGVRLSIPHVGMHAFIVA